MKAIKWLIIIIAIIFILFYVVRIQDIIMERIYPKKYEEYVEKYSKENNLDPLLVYAIIKAESNFNEKAISSTKAKGLMQLMDETAREIAEKNGYTLQSSEDIFNPETNIRIGTKSFSQLLEKYNGNEKLAMCAYNAGMGNVDNWIEEGIIKEDGSDIENIPYKDTNAYVRKILRDYKLYKRLYG